MNLYMYEILEDYKFAKTEAKREEIFTSFSKLIWENPNTRKLLDKPITFHIKPKLLHTEIGQVFSAYTSISRTVCPSTTKDTDFASLIRQKAKTILRTAASSQKIIFPMAGIPAKGRNHMDTLSTGTCSDIRTHAYKSPAFKRNRCP